MNEIEAEQLQMEISHIFESGANEIRVFEMVKSFVESRPRITQVDKLTMRDKFAAKAMQGLLSNPDWMSGYKGDKYIRSCERVIELSHKMADEMLKQR
jgi:hypothetical protein